MLYLQLLLWVPAGLSHQEYQRRPGNNTKVSHQSHLGAMNPPFPTHCRARTYAWIAWISGYFNPKLPALLPHPQAPLAWGRPGAPIAACYRQHGTYRLPESFICAGKQHASSSFAARFKTRSANLTISVNDGDTYRDAWLSRGTRRSHLSRTALQGGEQTLG